MCADVSRCGEAAVVEIVSMTMRQGESSKEKRKEKRQKTKERKKCKWGARR